VTHDLARAAALGDRAVLLRGGRVAWSCEGRSEAAALERAYRGAIGAGP